MAQNEFAIIGQYFSALGKPHSDTVLGVGDDAAVVEVPAGQQLVVSTDTSICDIHFPRNTSAADIAYKALAVNLSDLAAMGADPAWFTLSLTLPEVEHDWLQSFSESLDQTARDYGLQLIGGDTCRGDLSITIQIAGHVPSDKYLTRSGAGPGDLVLVSGQLGKAALGLASLQQKLELPGSLHSRFVDALNRPRPRLELIPFLRQTATAAIDISDGLQADLLHILEASHCGAVIERGLLPVDDWIRSNDCFEYALEYGDDYEICCTVPASKRDDIELWNLNHPDCKLSFIGEITESGLHMNTENGVVDLGMSRGGYQHFD